TPCASCPAWKWTNCCAAAWNASPRMGASRKPASRMTRAGGAGPPDKASPRHSPRPRAASGEHPDPWLQAPDPALLRAADAGVARRRGLRLHCFHIHHGLQAEADDWQARAHRLADLLDAGCHSRRVAVDVDGRGMEAAARDARYAALAELAVHAGVGHVLLAH